MLIGQLLRYQSWEYYFESLDLVLLLTTIYTWLLMSYPAINQINVGLTNETHSFTISSMTLGY